MPSVEQETLALSATRSRRSDPLDGEEINPAPGGGFRRDYYELALADGGVYRAFRDLDSEKWFVDGVYD